ncbi:hypothetical protein AB0D24_15435 [Streptomyces javensis]|uniref:hypothetical protein n=1 Tax=Streptomyces javensis TaxID=114698 RepID=UPI0033D38B02
MPLAEKLRRTLATLMTVGRHQPHLYRLLFSSPTGDPAAIHAAERTQDELLAIVGDLAGEQHARRFAALLLTSTHDMTGMEDPGVHDRQAVWKRVAPAARAANGRTKCLWRSGTQ